MNSIKEFLRIWWEVIVSAVCVIVLLGSIIYVVIKSNNTKIKASDLALKDWETSKLFILLNRDGNISKKDCELIKIKYEESLSK